MEPSDFSRLADSMAEFIQSRTTISVGPINRPSAISNTKIIIIIMISIALVSAPFIVKKLISGKTILHMKSIWMTGVVLVYFFSVSGGMFNIIRKIPMFLTDRHDPDKLVFFYRGSGVHLGAEGFSVGFLYTIVGLLLAFLCHAVVRVKNRNAQRLLMISALLVSVWAVRKVVFLSNWKTGYRAHPYWPSSWR